MRRTSMVTVTAVALCVIGGQASARDEGDAVSSVGQIIDTAVRTGQPVESQPEVAANVTVDVNGVPQGSVDGMSIAEIQDLVAVARQYKKSGSEVIAQAEHERAYIPVYETAMESDSFAGGEMAFDGTKSWVGLTGRAPASVTSAAAQAGVSVREDLPYSRAELERLHAEVHTSASAGAKRDAVSWIDESSMRIKVLTNVPAQEVEGDVASALATRAGALSSNLPIDVTRVDGSLGSNEDQFRRGGGHEAGCTVGFILRSHGSGAKRLGTAGHCVNPGTSTTYVNHPVDASSPTAISELWSHEGSSGDLGYFGHGGHPTIQTFYWKRNQKRYVENVEDHPSDYPPGKLLCHYGKATGDVDGASYCAHVWTRTASKTIDGVTHEKLTAVDEDVSRPGDSGGPWYMNGTAYGVHSGDVATLTGPRSAFTPVHHFSWFGFEVWQR